MNENVSVTERICSLSNYVYSNWQLFKTTSLEDSVLLLSTAYSVMFPDCRFIRYVVSLVAREVVIPLQIAFN